MPHDCRRVVVTGLGVISPIGLTVSDMWAALVAGKSGIDYISHFDPAFGHRSGWTFSQRCGSSLAGLAMAVKRAENVGQRPVDQQKDRDSLLYV